MNENYMLAAATLVAGNSNLNSHDPEQLVVNVHHVATLLAKQFSVQQSGDPGVLQYAKSQAESQS
jgi:hypothetical protein